MHSFTWKPSKEICENLCITFGGTCEVNQSQISMLIYEYELFDMSPNDIVFEMCTGLTKNFTSLFCLGK